MKTKAFTNGYAFYVQYGKRFYHVYANGVEEITAAVQHNAQGLPVVEGVVLEEPRTAATVVAFFEKHFADKVRTQGSKDPGRASRCIDYVQYDINSPTGTQVKYTPRGGINWFVDHRDGQGWQPLVYRLEPVALLLSAGKHLAAKVVLLPQYT